MPKEQNNIPLSPAAEPEKFAEAKKRFTFTENGATFTLEEPIVLGNGESSIESITLRKPNAGELRGIGSLLDVMQMDVDAIIKVLPRITTPTIHSAMVNKICFADITTIGKIIAGFSQPKKTMEKMMESLETDYS